MKKIRLIALIVLSMIATAGYSQMQFGLQVGPQFPMENMGDSHTGFTLMGTAKYFVNDEAAFGLNIGFGRFGTDYEDVSLSVLPVTAMFEYNLKEGLLIPYLGFDLGGYNVTSSFVFLGKKYSESEFNFGFAPTAGVKYDINENMYLTGSLKWNYVMAENDDISWLGLNLGIVFGL